MKIKILVLFVFTFIFCTAQNKVIDSLKTVLKAPTNDTTSINVLNVLSSRYYLNRDYQNAISAATNAKNKSKVINYKKGLARAYENIGLINIAQNNLEDAFTNFTFSLKEREILNDKKGISENYHQLGVVFYLQESLDKALHYFFIALEIKKGINHKEGMANTYNNIGVCYNKKANYTEALKFHALALEIREKLGNSREISSLYSSIGNVYGEMEKPSMALKYHLKALCANTITANTALSTAIFMNIGRDYTSLGVYDSSIKYINKALILAKQNGYADQVINAYGNLSGLYEKKEDYKNAFMYGKLYYKGRDSTYKENLKIQIAEMDAKYESEKKDNKIKFLNTEKELKRVELETKERNQKTVIISSVFIILTVLLLTFFVSKNNRHKQKLRVEQIEKEKIRAELTSLKNQISPHVMFNSLNTIFFQIDEHAENAKEMILLFADLLRYQLYECNTDFIAIEKEIDYLKKFIEIQRLRKSERCKIDFCINENVRDFNITPLLLIPLVENAFKYVTNDKGKENFVLITFEKENNKITFALKNTTHEEEINTKKEFGGIGLTNLKSRLDLIYANKHELNLFKEGNVYNAKLIIYV